MWRLAAPLLLATLATAYERIQYVGFPVQTGYNGYLREDGLFYPNANGLGEYVGKDSVAEDIRARIAGERPRLREGVDFPALPAWMSDRPYLTGAHLGRDATSETKSTANADPIAGKPLDAYTTACQELLVLDDLLYAMLGAEGRYVRARRVDAATGRVENANAKSRISLEPPSMDSTMRTIAGSRKDFSKTVPIGMIADCSSASLEKAPTFAAPPMNRTIGPKAPPKYLHRLSM